MVTIRIKTSMGKKLGLSSFAYFPHCPPSLAFSRGPCLVGSSSTGNPPTFVSKMRETQLLSTLPGINLSPLEADDGLLPAVLHLPLLVCGLRMTII